MTRWYNADGDLTKRVIQERWDQAFWSNPLSGKTVPYTQTDRITTVLGVPGDFASATETNVGENVYTDPVTHRRFCAAPDARVVGADGTLDFRAGQQPFIDAFVDGDMSVFDAVCAALRIAPQAWDDAVVAWTVLIVDDHAGFRRALERCSRPTGSMSRRGGRRESAVALARRLRPRVVLLDVQLPGMDGFAVAERLAAEPAAPAVVLISSRGAGRRSATGWSRRRRVASSPSRSSRGSA